MILMNEQGDENITNQADLNRVEYTSIGSCCAKECARRFVQRLYARLLQELVSSLKGRFVFTLMSQVSLCKVSLFLRETLKIKTPRLQKAKELHFSDEKIEHSKNALSLDCRMLL
jgi:hypothetical protein